MAQAPTKPDLVVGASGYIGTNLVEYLRARGREVRAVSRNIEVLEGRDWTDVEICRADVLKPETLDAVLENVDTAYYLVHSMATAKFRAACASSSGKPFPAAIECTR